MSRLKIAFVVQRYGADVVGGSEYLCRTVVERLCKHYSCDVITTCARDYVTWRNEYPRGRTICNGVNVIRFPVDAERNQREFDRISAQVFSEQPDVAAQETWMKAQGPYSTELLSFIERSRDQYDAFVFFTYLYCTTYFGLPLVRDRAILVPTAHDEPPIYLSIFDGLFRAAKRFLFLTPEEKDFVLRRFCLPHDAGDVGGFGLDTATAASDGMTAAADVCIGGNPYMLYLGRIDESKGCRTLLEWFERYTNDYPDADLHLVLAGKQVMDVRPAAGVILPGVVPESAKATLIRNAAFMAAPSPYESLCISALESWSNGVPVLGNGKCLVLAGQCRRSGGGLWYRDYEEFAGCVSLLSADAQLRRRLGANGRAYVLSEFGWQHVEQRYIRNISLIMQE